MKLGMILPQNYKKTDSLMNRFSSGKRDSNPRPSAWEADALPTELLPHSFAKINKILDNFLGKCKKTIRL